MFLSLLWPALFFTALLSAGAVAFTLITRLERMAAGRASPPKLRRRSLLLTAFGLALTALPFDLPAAHRLWLPPAAALLIALAWLDWRHRWLPDRLTQPLLWGGMLCNLDARWATLGDAVIGAAAGYGGLWLLNALYRQVRRRNGIGQGDFKLLAALGAWLGWTMLPLLVCLAAMFGLGMALTRGRRNRRAWRTRQPFGIALAAAGWLLLLMDAGQNAPALFG
ncbi:prepilin peptidase [Serratia sp. SRS-8-S-2018]|jgi:leader peptidase (prepilin peptidase)/N-methyltransferase|uniref:Leader peptidase (Prepilin peptidase) / N-methyltransferase n=1 Tax=Serratia nematodiphila TaxID=458197 RepID=A0A1G5FRB1_9GAMM|nr:MULTISPECIES: A24 family peptidase [Serratia]ANM76865.1 type IV leader peptidase family protein [Serratia marcescens]EIT7187572.1 prepilin peptidase [Serratia marcescens]EJC6391001.1 prepilin peptidase [Serratia marcescens]KFF89252.1 prepilin peptidase [Serratia nematodiphila DZ0503SBS1]MCI2403071.1 A24 family peptidase [Serratia sp. PGPR-27]